MVAPFQQSRLFYLAQALGKDTSARLTIAREISPSTWLAGILDVANQDVSSVGRSQREFFAIAPFYLSAINMALG